MREDQQLAPQTGDTDPGLVLQLDDLGLDDREAILDSLVDACHGYPDETLDGTGCTDCEHFGGFLRYSESGDARRDLRGLCLIPKRRPHLHARGKSAVPCLEAPMKVPGARRGDRIATTHCDGCAWNRGGGSTKRSTTCSSPKGIRYTPILVG